jgi:glycosyltransferase involved in cell wall biosynthesis
LKVLYDGQIFRLQRYGGISRYFCELAPRIDAASGVRARILAPGHRNEYLRALGRPVALGWHDGGDDVAGRLARLAVRTCQRWTPALWRPEVLHETYYFGELAAASPHTRRVLTLYDAIHERHPDRFRNAANMTRAKRAAAARADLVICISESTRRDAIELLGIAPDKLAVTHLAAQMPSPAPPGPPDADGTPYLLYVGERGGYKNWGAMIAAIAASATLRELRLVCFGGGPFTAEEVALLQRLGLEPARITQQDGDDRRLAALYAGALCLVYPSLYEGFGIPPLEAMQCGCPVVCSGTSSLPEVVGDAARQFDPQDPESMRVAIEGVAGSPERAALLRERGRAQAARFSWDRCASQTLALYRRLQ